MAEPDRREHAVPSPIQPDRGDHVTLLDGALIGLVMLLAIGVIAGVSRMLADEDGDGRPDAPWPPWPHRHR
jgi:hypothetical protein